MLPPRLTLRVSYPQTAPEGPSSDVLLKSLWQHLSNYYFKPIQAAEIERIDYLKRVLNTQSEGMSPLTQVTVEAFRQLQVRGGAGLLGNHTGHFFGQAADALHGVIT